METAQYPKPWSQVSGLRSQSGAESLNKVHVGTSRYWFLDLEDATKDSPDSTYLAPVLG